MDIIDQYIGSFVCGLSIIVEALVLWSVAQGRASRSWVPVNGKILSSVIKVVQRHDNRGPSVSYQPKIKYTYAYEGRDYTSNRIGYLLVYGAEASAQKVADKFSEGKAVHIYINPAKPSCSVLIRGVPLSGAVVGIGVPLFMFFIGLLLSQNYLAGRH